MDVLQGHILAIASSALQSFFKSPLSADSGNVIDRLPKE